MIPHATSKTPCSQINKYKKKKTNITTPDNLEGWDEVGGRIKREGTYVYLWLIHVAVWQKLTQHCKAIILQLKINKTFTPLSSSNWRKQLRKYKDVYNIYRPIIDLSP